VKVCWWHNPEVKVRGCARELTSVVNKLRSFKIDFSERKHFKNLGPTHPPSHRGAKNHM